LKAKNNQTPGWNTRSWLSLRTAVQVIAFLLFIVLFLNWRPLLMRLDPLAMLANLISSRTFEALSAIALIMVALALVTGRAWCGWLCPLGTVLDWFSFNRLRRWNLQLHDGWRSVKYMILFAIILAAIFTNLTLMIFDPLTIMVRSFAVAVWPALDSVITGGEMLLSMIPPLQPAIANFNDFVRPALLPAEPLIYTDSLLFGLIFLGIIALNLISERFWCRYLCPLGAFYGLIAKIGIIRRRVNTSCIHCKLCEDACPTGTIQRKKDCSSDPSECIVCLKCMDSCPCATSDFGPVYTAAKWNSYDPHLRHLLIGSGAAVVLALLSHIIPAARRKDTALVWPPGATERSLCDRCIRCGLCIKSCPTAAIQPVPIGNDARVLWAPSIVPRTGFCQYSCNNCGQACPAQAIPALSLKVKQDTPIGWAYIDRNRCLPWAENTPCIVCEEMCPVPQKAIILTTVQVNDGKGGKIELQRPGVVKQRCIGCGLCEYKCPVSGQAAIRVEPNDNGELL
jgi:polyferredoxin